MRRNREIRALKTPRVGEDRSGLLEGDLVLEQVRRSLRAIPLEHALSIYETTHQESGTCEAGAAPGRDPSRSPAARLSGSADGSPEKAHRIEPGAGSLRPVSRSGMPGVSSVSRLEMVLTLSPSQSVSWN